MEKKLSKKSLDKSFWLWYYGHLTCFTYQHMQTFGYMCSMLPLIEELYEDEDEQREMMKSYSTFFNTEPQLGGSLVVGVTAGLEEARANGKDVTDETIIGIKAGLMGPLAGIGDSVVVGTIIPILLGIALGLSNGGSPLGAIFYIITWNILSIFGMKYIFNKGYDLGGKAVHALVGEKSKAIQNSIVMVGIIVIGSVAATWIDINTALEILPASGGNAAVTLQASLDAIYPKLLNVVFVLLCWYLMAKKNVSPIKTMGIMGLIAFIGVFVGFFNPGLTY